MPILRMHLFKTILHQNLLLRRIMQRQGLVLKTLHIFQWRFICTLTFPCQLENSKLLICMEELRQEQLRHSLPIIDITLIKTIIPAVCLMAQGLGELP